MIFVKLHAEGGKGGFDSKLAQKTNENFFNQRRQEQIAQRAGGNPRVGPTKENANKIPGKRGRKYKIKGNPRV